MIHCDEPGCVAPVAYDTVKLTAPYVDPKTGVLFKVGDKVKLPIRPPGGAPDWAIFKVGDLFYCGWCVDGARTRMAEELGLDKVFASRVKADGYTVAQAGTIVVRASRGRHEGWALLHPHRPESKEPERLDPWNEAEHEAHLARIAHEVTGPALGVHVTSITDEAEWRAQERRQAEAKRPPV